jgi:hypothetical protein
MVGATSLATSSGGRSKNSVISEPEPISLNLTAIPFKKGPPRKRRPWRTPRRDRLFDSDWLDGYVDWDGVDHEEFVPTVLVIGPSIREFNVDWTLRSGRDSPEDWDRRKLDHFMRDGTSGGLTQDSALSERGFHGLYLHCVGGLYCVGSGGNHRVAAAHLKGIPCLRATVNRGYWKPGTPVKMKEWFERTRIALLERVPYMATHSPRFRLGSSSLYKEEWLTRRRPESKPDGRVGPPVGAQT